MSLETIAESVWYGTHARAKLARAALAPLAGIFGGAAWARGRLYDRGVFSQSPLTLPAISIGNLTVGGTGKTPLAAWTVGELRARGVRPALVLRGVGGDETQVHALLNPGVPVVADADRVRGAARAAAQGAEVVVLDDAFQHRRAARVADVVLVAAETFDGHARLLPAGPYREPIGALARATVIVVTRKSASAERARIVAARIATALGPACVPIVIAHLAPAGLLPWGAGRDAAAVHAPALARGERVLAVAGIGAPDAFAAQLRAAGAEVTLARFGDHHAYDAADVAALVHGAAGGVRVVTTLKDAVKLGPIWPRHAPTLWYVTQRVTLEQGASALVDVLDAVTTVARAAAADASQRSVPESAVHGRDA